jgi:hypothetical protein
MGKTLLVCNAKTEPIQCQYYKDDLLTTMKRLRKALVDSREFDNKTIEKFLVLLSKIWLSQEEKTASKNNSASDDVQNRESQEIKLGIEKLRTENSGITYEKWNEELTKRRERIKNSAELHFPHSWTGIEFALSVLRILNISECTLPFAGIVLSRAGGNKTLSIGMLIPWISTYYTRNFTARSFVSHNTAVPVDKLPEIDMLPKIRFRLFLTPELTPTFSANEDELRETIGIIVSIMDGKGYINNSGAQGRRGYSGNYMFVWVGAAVEIPYRVHKMLAILGPKLYFFRLPYFEKSDQQLLGCLNENFEKKRREVQDAVIDYLKWFEICPYLLEDKESGLLKMPWDSEKDEASANNYLIKLGKLIGKLRGHVDIWPSKHSTQHEHEYSEYSYAYTQIEDPARATTQLYNLCRGRALGMGRNYISLDDVRLAAKVVLSTASVERVAIIDLLLAKKGSTTVSQISKGLPMSKSTALKAMTELTALKVVHMNEVDIEHNPTKEITLREEFNWLLQNEFAKLRKGFNPVDNSSYDEEIMFWSRFAELAQKSPDGTVIGGELQDSLVSSGKFFQGDAKIFIEDKVKLGQIEDVPGQYDKYRKSNVGGEEG